MPRRHLFTKKGEKAIAEIKKAGSAYNPYAVATARIKGARLKPKKRK
jgi:hypothetical protein